MSLYYGDKRIVKPGIQPHLKAYITRNFDDIVPFEVHKGVGFQIRFTVEEYKVLPAKIKAILKKHVVKNEPITEYPEWEKRYKRDFYWGGSKSYIFNYTAMNAYTLETKCEYGYEGLEKSNKIAFIDANEFPPEILNNMGKYEKHPFKMVETKGRK